MKKLKIIALTYIFVATLDCFSAVFQNKIRGGQKPLQVFRFILSGIFGNDAFSDNVIYPVLGIVIHFVITTIWATIFFWSYPNIQLPWMNKYAVGASYALIIWSMMNPIVMPLSDTPPLPLSLGSVLTEIFILTCEVGIPISWIYHKTNLSMILPLNCLKYSRST